jgi:predicted transcriptional regulator
MTQAQRIPDDDDIELELLRAAVEEAREEIRRGEGIPHERVREWLLDIAQSKMTKPPLP